MTEPPYTPPPTDWQSWSDALRPPPPPNHIQTSLDHLALIDETLSSDSFARRTANVAIQRKALVQAADNQDRRTRAAKLLDCSSSLALFAHKPTADPASFTHSNTVTNARGKLVWADHYTRHVVHDGGAVSPFHCHCRACPLCQRLRRQKLAAKFYQRAKAMQSPKLLTLTLKHTQDPLPDQCHRIKEAFRRLRAHAVWKQQVRGGFWVLEVVQTSTAQEWHVHIHALINAKYLPQEWISQRWLKITGDSMIVDIRVCPPKRARYLTKYISKGVDLTQDAHALWEYYEALHRSRDTNLFGECYDAPAPPSDLMYVGMVGTILARAKSGDQNAQFLLPFVERMLLDTIQARESP